MLSYSKTFEVKVCFSIVPVLQLDSQGQLYAWIVLSARLYFQDSWPQSLWTFLLGK